MCCGDVTYTTSWIECYKNNLRIHLNVRIQCSEKKIRVCGESEQYLYHNAFILEGMTGTGVELFG